MELAIICLAAFIASGLTLFSGFGLGTLLMPVVAVFFPLEVAVAMTAVVHLANNLFKLLLLGRGADARVLLRFGIPAVLFAWIGAALLVDLSL
ncbi:TSUP family transporter, partial [Gammaproteobacteria bacterium]|nr:TSUP family transporter [Gammaproteobacteria bacterium]